MHLVVDVARYLVEHTNKESHFVTADGTRVRISSVAEVITSLRAQG